MSYYWLTLDEMINRNIHIFLNDYLKINKPKIEIVSVVLLCIASFSSNIQAKAYFVKSNLIEYSINIFKTEDFFQELFINIILLLTSLVEHPEGKIQLLSQIPVFEPFTSDFLYPNIHEYANDLINEIKSKP